MSEKPPQAPATFKLDDANVVVVDADEPGRVTRGTVRITPEAEPAQLPVPIETPPCPRARRGFGWGTLFWAATAGLVRARLGPRHHQADRGSVRAQREPRLCSGSALPLPPRWRSPSSRDARYSA